MQTLNLGCGTARITGAINVDVNPITKPELAFNLTHRFPLKDDLFEKVYLFHCIEHIERFKQQFVLYEIHRVMKLGGKLIISYPEFSKILENWLKNKDADRSFWHATIYGRQAYAGDYHYAGMHTPDFIETLRGIGFLVDKHFPEPTQDHNMVLHCHKVETPINYEEVLYREIFQNVTI